MSTKRVGWFEKSNLKKKLFKKKYGRKPNKDEIKMLKKNIIDLGFAYQRDNLPLEERIYVMTKGGMSTVCRKA